MFQYMLNNCWVSLNCWTIISTKQNQCYLNIKHFIQEVYLNQLCCLVCIMSPIFAYWSTSGHLKKNLLIFFPPAIFKAKTPPWRFVFTFPNCIVHEFVQNYISGFCQVIDFYIYLFSKETDKFVCFTRSFHLVFLLLYS